MRYVILFLLIILTNDIFCQDFEIPKVTKFRMGLFYWPDTIISEQVKYWDNGNIMVEYSNLGSNKKLKKEYTKEGLLKLTVEVIQRYVIDTVATIDPMIGELIFEVYKGFHDVPNGKYTEFKKEKHTNEVLPYTYGQYLEGNKIGIWLTELTPCGKVVELTYNNNSQLEGKYIEYYNNFQDQQKSIKWIGQLGQQEQLSTYINPLTGDLISKNIIKTERIGIWTKYDIEGKEICTVAYNWKQ